MNSGIYRIKNILNNKCYYGSSKNIDVRFKKHLSDLNKNKHPNCILQYAWNKYGSINFIFEIIELCAIDKLLEVEQIYLNTKPTYNIGINASGGDNLTNNPNRIEIINKIKNTSILNYKNMSVAEKIYRFSKPGNKNPNWKNGCTIKYCKCGKLINKKNNFCMKCIDKTKENNSFYNKKHTDKTKDIISKTNLGRKPINRIKISINSIVFDSLYDASKILNISVSTIHYRINSKNIKFDLYKKC